MQNARHANISCSEQRIEQRNGVDVHQIRFLAAENFLELPDGG